MEIRNSKELAFAIMQLENKRLIQKELLVDQFHATYEHFKPLNLVKNAFNEIDLSASSVVDTLASAAVSTGAGILSKKIFVGGSGNIFKKILGLAVEFGVANVVAKNSDGIKGAAKKLFRHFVKPKKEYEEE